MSGRMVVPLAIAALVLLSAINYVGVAPGAVTQNLFTILKLAALAALVAAGAWAVVPAPAVASAQLVPRDPILAVGTSLVPILFAYGGWQQTNFIAEELVDAERTLPRALVLGTAAVVVVYLLANVAYLRVLGVAGLAASQAPAADVLQAAVGPWGRRLIGIGIAASTFGFLGLVILVSPRVYQAMAADGAFFPALARLHPRFRTPATAIVIQGVWAVALTLTGTYAQLLDYVVFGDWIFFGLTVATLFVHRRRAGAPAAYAVPGYPLTPALFVAAAAFVVWSSVRANPGNAAIGTLLLLAGIPVFAFWRRRTAGA
jgi:APA family basic amino acid/polyamine antiporter